MKISFDFPHENHLSHNITKRESGYCLIDLDEYSGSFCMNFRLKTWEKPNSLIESIQILLKTINNPIQMCLPIICCFCDLTHLEMQRIDASLRYISVEGCNAYNNKRHRWDGYIYCHVNGHFSKCAHQRDSDDAKAHPNPTLYILLPYTIAAIRHNSSPIISWKQITAVAIRSSKTTCKLPRIGNMCCICVCVCVDLNIHLNKKT